jgi:hypothetical protein
VCHGRDIAGHDPSTHSVVEGASDDEMDLQHCLGCEWLPPVGWVEFLVVECFEMVRAQTPDRHFAEGGESVPVDIAPVPVPGGASQLELLARQSPCGQVGAEAEGAPLVVASVQLFGETSRQLLCLFTAGACWMPSATFLASDRVESFVDDRIPAVALLAS